MVLFRGLERTHTFLVPIINPPFADNSPHFYHPDPQKLENNGVVMCRIYSFMDISGIVRGRLEKYMGRGKKS